MAAKIVKPQVRDLVVCLKDVDWHQLGTQLKVPSDKLKQIGEEYHGPRKLNEVLSYWLNNDEEATWETVLKALERMGGHKSLVSDLQTKYCTPQRSLEYVHHSTISSQDSRMYAKSRLSEAEREDFEHQIRLDVERIRCKFTMLQSALRKSLTQKEVKAKQIVAHVIGYGIFKDQHRDKDESLLKSSEEKLKSAISIEDVFIELSNYWSCIEYDILTIIINEYGDDNDQKMIQEYRDAVKVFFQNRKISEIPKDSKFTNGHSSGETHERVIIKLNLDNPHLQTVTNLKSKVCEILGVKPSVLLIEEIKEGCIEVILLVPKHVVKVIFGDHLTKVSCKEQLLAASVIFFSGKDFKIDFIPQKRPASSNQGSITEQSLLVKGSPTAEVYSSPTPSLEQPCPNLESKKIHDTALSASDGSAKIIKILNQPILPPPPPHPPPPPPQRPRTASTPQSITRDKIFLPGGVTNEKFSLSKFVSLYHKEIPIQVRVCKGFRGPNEDTSISEGDRFNVHFIKHTKIVTVEYDNGSRCNIPLNSAVLFGILYNPDNNLSDAMKGYRFETVADLLRTLILPALVIARKAFQGSSAESSICANEVLLVKKVVSKRLGTKQQLKVFSLKENKEKVLNPNCDGNFSTRPRDICLFLPEILKHLPDIFPCKAVLYNVSSLAAERSADMSGGLPNRSGSMTKFGSASLVTMMHSSIETSIVATSALEQHIQNARLLDIPIDLDILVRVEHIADEDETHRLYEDATFIYEHFDPSWLCDFKSKLANNSPDTQSQFYTNIHYGQERDGINLESPRIIDPTTGKPRKKSIPSSLLEEHYQVSRKSRDPIPIENVPRSASNSQDGSMEQSPPTRKSVTTTHSPPTQSWRSPLPPSRIKKDVSQGSRYEYVEINPRFTQAVSSVSRMVCGARRVSESDIVPSSPPGLLADNGLLGSKRKMNSTLSTRRSGSDSCIVEAQYKSSIRRPDSSSDFDAILNDLDQLSKQLDDIICSNTSSNIASSKDSDLSQLGQQQISFDIKRNKDYLKSLDNSQLIRLLEAIGLEQYSGDLLSEYDDGILRNELAISSKLHRMKLLRIISGQYSVKDLVAGPDDGYVMMLATPK